MTGSLIRSNSNLTPRRDDLFFPFEQAFDNFFDDFFRSNPLSRVKAAGGYPKMNILEQDGNFQITVALPGMRSEDVQVHVKDDVLSIRGRVSEEHRTPSDGVCYIRELKESAFERFVQLPEHVVGDPEASMKDGLLKLTWKTDTKRVENSRKIEVKDE
jgi:HSP20 family protein